MVILLLTSPEKVNEFKRLIVKVGVTLKTFEAQDLKLFSNIFKLLKFFCLGTAEKRSKAPHVVIFRFIFRPFQDAQ